MFTPEQRAQLRSELLERAAGDPRISGAAITGSVAAGREDRWSDIDLAFGVADGGALPEVLSDWTAHLYERHLAVHHFDMNFGPWTYRVFLLPGALQVDLAFVPAGEFRPLAPTFQLVSGKANESREAPSPRPVDLIGMGWLYAIHARGCIARRKLWQGEYMISGVRDQALALACIRHGLPAVHGRGMDELPIDVAAQFEGALVRQLDAGELSRAFQAAVSGLIAEIRGADAELAGRLEGPLWAMCEIDGEAAGLASATRP